MSERIFVSSNNNVATQNSSVADIRYSGVVAKQRLHPRLIIRKYRKTNLSSSSLQDNPTSTMEFNNFILTDADEEVEEKYQIVQTFGPDFIFLYGPKPRIFTYAGVLYDTIEKPWAAEWQRAWDNVQPVYGNSGFTTSGGADTQKGIMAATNVIINGGIARLEYGGSALAGDPSTQTMVREGYIIKMSIKRSGDRPNSASFQLAMIVTSRLDF